MSRVEQLARNAEVVLNPGGIHYSGYPGGVVFPGRAHMTVLMALVIVALVVVWWRWSSRNGCGRWNCEHCRGQRRLSKKQPSWPRVVIHYGWTLLLYAAGCVVERVPRRWLSDSFVAWYNRSLDSWTWNP